MKKALVMTLLKKLILDKEIFENYRPVSNLASLSKVIEKGSLKRLSGHMDEHNLHTPSQSANIPLYSTETALLKILNDIPVSLYVSQGVILMFPDLSAAFDTIDHNILLLHLESRIGVTGMASTGSSLTLPTAIKWYI